MDRAARPGAELAVSVQVQHAADASRAAPSTTRRSPARHAATRERQRAGLAARVQSQRSASIETDDFVAEVTDLNGGLRKFVLKGDRYQKRGTPVDIVTTDRPEFLPLAIQLKGWSGDQSEDNWQHAAALAARGASSRATLDGLRVTRKIEAGSGPYQLWLTTRIENHDTRARNVQLEIATHHYVTRESEGSKVPLLPVRSSHTSHAVCRHDDELERKDRKALGNAKLEFPAPVVFSGVENVYFLSAIAPDGDGVERCGIEQIDRGRDAKGERARLAVQRARSCTRRSTSRPAAARATARWRISDRRARPSSPPPAIRSRARSRAAGSAAWPRA